jgi:hypothetical protein
MHAAGTPANIIANTFMMTPQSLEKILAHLDGRDERILESKETPELQDLRTRNADLANRLAKYEDVQGGETVQHVDGDETPSQAEEDSEEAA